MGRPCVLPARPAGAELAPLLLPCRLLALPGAAALGQQGRRPPQPLCSGPGVADGWTGWRWSRAARRRTACSCGGSPAAAAARRRLAARPAAVLSRQRLMGRSGHSHGRMLHWLQPAGSATAAGEPPAAAAVVERACWGLAVLPLMPPACCLVCCSLPPGQVQAAAGRQDRLPRAPAAVHPGQEQVQHAQVPVRTKLESQCFVAQAVIGTAMPLVLLLFAAVHGHCLLLCMGTAAVCGAC